MCVVYVKAFSKSFIIREMKKENSEKIKNKKIKMENEKMKPNTPTYPLNRNDGSLCNV